jgi:hypothetical protein
MAADSILTKLKDDAVILSLISGAKEGGLEVFIWKLIGNSKHLGQVRIESIRKIRKDFCIVPSHNQERQVQDLMSAEGYIDLYIPASALILRCQIKQTEAPVRYYLSFPRFAAHVERRKNPRLHVHDTSEVKILFAKTSSSPRVMTQHFFKSCVDISSGGFSFFVSKMEQKFFKNGDAIPGLELRMGNWAAKVEIQIISINEVEPDEFNGLTYKVWRVCCKFSQLDQFSKKQVDKFILERIKNELHAINR